MLLRAFPKYLLNTDKLGTLTTSLGNLFQYLNACLVKKCFKMFSLNLLCCIFEPFPCILSLNPKGKRSALHYPLAFLGKHQKVMMFSLSLLCSKQDQPKALSLSSQDMPSSPFTSFVERFWMNSRICISFLSCEAQY